MNEKRYGKKVDDVDDTIIHITEDGNDFAWFLSDDYLDEQVDKIVQRLNELSDENDLLKLQNQKIEITLLNNQLAYNDLQKENEQLVNDVRDLRKENYGLIDGMAFKDEVEIPKLSERISDLECENEQLKKDLFEARKELLWATSDEVDRALYYEDEVEELRKEIFE